MEPLFRRIADAKVPDGSLAMWSLAQAGFAFKNPQGRVIYVDPYLSNVVEREFGFKRLSLAPIASEDVKADWIVSSHEHLDHLDTDMLPIVASNNPNCRFAGTASCAAEYDKAGIPSSRQLIMQAGGDYSLDGFRIRAIKADHGELSPDALSLLIECGGISVLFTGDTAYRPDLLTPSLESTPDVLLPCINGVFGNMNGEEAAQLTADISPRLAVPCHFWMFAEQNGDPQSFVDACKRLCPNVQYILMCPGDGLLIGQDKVVAL